MDDVEQIVDQSQSSAPADSPVPAAQPVEGQQDSATAAPPAPDPNDRRAVVADAFKEAAKKAETNRGKHAAFQPRKPQNGQFAQGKVNVPEDWPAMPKSLKKELEGHWRQAPKDLLTAINQREADFERGIQQYRSQVEAAQKQASEFAEVFRPYEMMLKAENATPVQAVSDLMRTAALLRVGTPWQKAQAVAQTMRQFGISPQIVAEMLGARVPQQAAQVPVNNQVLNQMYQEVQGLKQQAQAKEQMEAQQRERHSLSNIEKFAADHPHFDAVHDKMLALMTAKVFGDLSDKSDMEQLQIAYDAAVRLDPALSAQIQAAQAQKQTQQQEVQRSKRAAVQLNGAPNGSVRHQNVDPSDRAAVLRAAFNAQRV